MELTKDELHLINRAKDVLSAKGYNPDTKEILMAAVKDLLTKRDPAQKAERAPKRLQAHKAKSKRPESTAPWQNSPSRPRPQRQFVPARIRHEVWLRDLGRCAYKNRSGERCPETRMLELDHIVPVCRGGGNTVKNLRLLCRHQNQQSAIEILGVEFMKLKRKDGITWKVLGTVLSCCPNFATGQIQ